jgi:hypothetical protein
MTIPQMAGTTFAIIITVSIIGLRTPPRSTETTVDDAADERTTIV